MHALSGEVGENIKKNKQQQPLNHNEINKLLEQ